MPVLKFDNCDLSSVGPLRDGAGNLVEWDVSDGGIYTVQVQPLGAVFTTAVLELKKSNGPGAKAKSLSTPVTFTNTASSHLTDRLSPEAAFASLHVTTAEAAMACTVLVWRLPASPAVSV